MSEKDSESDHRCNHHMKHFYEQLYSSTNVNERYPTAETRISPIVLTGCVYCRKPEQSPARSVASSRLDCLYQRAWMAAEV